MGRLAQPLYQLSVDAYGMAVSHLPRYRSHDLSLNAALLLVATGVLSRQFAAVDAWMRVR